MIGNKRQREADENPPEPAPLKRRSYWPKKADGRKLRAQIDLPKDVPVWSSRGLQISSSAPSDHGQALRPEITDSKPNALVLSHPPLQAYEAAQATLRGLRKCLERPVEPANSPTSIDSRIEDVLESNPIQGRSWRGIATVHVYVRSSAASRQLFVLSAINDDGVVRWLGYVDQQQFTLAEANARAQAFADLLNHLPEGFSIETIAPTKKPSSGNGRAWKAELFAQAALRRTGSGTARQLVCGTMPVLKVAARVPKGQKKQSKKQPKKTADSNDDYDDDGAEEKDEVVTDPAKEKKYTALKFVCNIPVVDPRTLLPSNYDHHIHLSHVKGEVPDVPDDCLLLTKDTGQTWEGKVVRDVNGRMRFRSALDDVDGTPPQVVVGMPPEAVPQYQNAERLARQLVFQLTGRLLTLEDASKRALEITKQFGGDIRGHKSRDQVPAENMWYIVTVFGQRATLLRPSGPAEKAGCNIKEGIVLNTMDQSWFAPIVQILEDTYRATRNFDQSWADAARIAEAVQTTIDAGERPPSWCDCAPGMSATSTHTCSGCMLAVVCDQRVTAPSGMLVCVDCFNIIGAKARAVSKASYVANYVKKSLVGLCWKEAKSRGMDINSSTYKENVLALLASIKKDLDEAGGTGMQWRSVFTGKLNTMPQRTASRGNPESPSGDAFFPYASFNDQWFVHCAGNVGLVEQPLNYAKNIQLPAILDIVKQNLNIMEHRLARAAKGQVAARNVVEVLEEKIVASSAQLRKIRRKSAYTISARLQKPFNASVLQNDKQEWISGKLRENDTGPWDKEVTVKDRLSVRDEFGQFELRDAQQWRAKALHYIRYFGLDPNDFPQQNGCFYFCAVSSIPTKWSSKVAFALCADRTCRVRDLCNADGLTIDTPTTVYIFCIIVVCIVKCTVKPNDVDDETFAAMKARFEEFLHLPMVTDVGDALRFTLGHFDHEQTMWTGVHPVTLEFDFKRSNMLLETCTSNWLKSDYPESQYPLLKQMVRDVNLGKDLLDREVKVKPRLARVAADIKPTFFEISPSNEPTAVEGEFEIDEVDSDPEHGE